MAENIAEKEIGVVNHWYDKLGVAVVELAAALKTGDKVKVRHGETEFEDTVVSMQVDHKDVLSGKRGDEVAVKLSGKAKEGSRIFKIE